MNSKYYTITIFISLIILGIFIIDKIYKNNYQIANVLYQVYLNGQNIGMIDNQEALYNLINTEQQEIKNKYQVGGVYPPSNFNIVKVNTYNAKVTPINEIYQKIEEVDDFTIKGYTITIKKAEDQKILINVLDKKVFEESINKFVASFISMDLYEAYINNTQEKIEDVGKYIEAMYFNENITIKENYISVNDKIYTSEDELSQFLLFGENAQMNSYQVKIGDTISSIAEEHKINSQEFLVANPSYKEEDTLLVIGSMVNVTILNPVLNFVVEIRKIEDLENKFMTTTEYDNTKPSSYSEITQAGVSGIMRVTEQYKVTNGEASSEVIITNKETIRETVNQVLTKGKRFFIGGITGSYVDNGLDWGWPTNTPYVITSKFGYRWGELHTGIDISGTGHGSPIYAIADGTIVQAATACDSCERYTSGTYIVINHGNNYYSSYLHLSSLSVKLGDKVTRGQKIGSMGSTGWSTGTHLHLGFSEGEPYTSAAKYMDPLKTIYK